MNYEFALTTVSNKVDYYHYLARVPKADPEVVFFAENQVELFDYLYHYLLKAGDIFDDGDR